MKKAFVLSTCKTCQKILDKTKWPFEVQDIKVKNIDSKTLAFAKEALGSYEALFSRRAMKYRSWGLNERSLNELDYKKYILKEYTFLKRPVFILEDKVFAGNKKTDVQALIDALEAYR